MRIWIIVALCLVPALVPALAVAQPARSPAELRQICADAMNADPAFSEAIIMTINEETFRQHKTAGESIAKNEKHVVFAYAALWLLAAGFVIFLWRRQQALKTEIGQLRRDLEAASK